MDYILMAPGASAPMDVDRVPPVPAVAPGAERYGTPAPRPVATAQIRAVRSSNDRYLGIVMDGPHAPMCVKKTALLPPAGPLPPAGVYVCAYEGAHYWVRINDIRVACLICHHYSCLGTCGGLPPPKPPAGAGAMYQ